MNNIPYDRLISQPMTYPSTQPPFVPNIQVMPEAEPILVAACSEVANEVSMRASTSIPRTYCYNVMSSNNWNNELFIDAVQLTCDYAVLLAATRRGTNPMSVLREASNEAMRMLTSSLVVEDYNLQRMLSREEIHSATVNNQTLMSVVEEITHMTHQARSQGRYNRPMLSSPNRTTRANHRYANTASSGVAGSAITTGSAFGRTQHQHQPTNKVPGRFATRSLSGTPPSLQEPQQQTEAPSPQVPVEPQIKQISGDIESMDRDAHNIVYFGKEFKVPTGPLRRKFEESVEIYENAMDGSSQVNPGIIVSDSIETLSHSLRTDRTKALLEDNNLSVFHSYAYLVVPVISSVELLPLFERLKQATSFEAVVQVLVQDFSNKEGEELRHTLTYISQINRVLTRMVNDFIKVNLNQPGITIGDFIEDVPGLGKWLNERFSSKYNQAYQVYQRTVLDKVFQFNSSIADDKTLVVSTTSEYADDGVYAEPIAIPMSMTYISATSKELGYNIDSTHQVLTATSAKMLHRLMLAVEALDNRDHKSVISYIVTSDDVRYKVSRVAGEEEAMFVLSEA